MNLLSTMILFSKGMHILWRYVTKIDVKVSVDF